MNARNNVNGVGQVPRTEVFTLKHADLLERQLAFVRKAVTELNPFANVYFEICNEPYFGWSDPGLAVQRGRYDRRRGEGPAEPARDRAEYRQWKGRDQEPAHGRVALQLPLCLAPPDAVSMNRNFAEAGRV